MRSHRTDQARRTGLVTTGVLSGVLTLAVAGCGGSGSSNPQAGPASSHHAMTHHAMTHHAMAETAPFGPDCGMVPATGMGSFRGMSMDPAVTAAMHNPLLTSFAADAARAGLGSTLNSAHGVTIFAPENKAFSRLPGTEMTMMHSSAELAKILKYHVVSGRVTAMDLASGKTLTTLEGGMLKASKMGSVYEVNSASVICGNIQTANATIYIIDKVLVPMH